MRRLEKVFESDLSSGEMKSFIFVPRKADERLKGILVNGDTELSLGFKNGLDLKLQRSKLESSDSVPPNQKIYRLNENLKSEIIKGLIKNTEPLNASISVYFIIQKDK